MRARHSSRPATPDTSSSPITASEPVPTPIPTPVPTPADRPVNRAERRAARRGRSAGGADGVRASTRSGPQARTRPAHVRTDFVARRGG